MTDPKRAAVVLQQLRRIGVDVSIDDYGTGHASLNYLKQFDIDELKIDRSFIMNLDIDSSDAIIVASTVELGHNLGLRIVAEGVEDGDTLAWLEGLGCDMAQGYHIGRPMAPEAITRAGRRRVVSSSPPAVDAASGGEHLMLSWSSACWRCCRRSSSAARCRDWPSALPGMVDPARGLACPDPDHRDLSRRRPDAARGVHIGTYVAAGVFVAVNWRVPGLLVDRRWWGLNGMTIALNGGQLPASRRCPAHGRNRRGSGELHQLRCIAHPVLPLLGDVFVWPAPFPFANVFSIGDVLIVVGRVLRRAEDRRVTAGEEALASAGRSWLARRPLRALPSRSMLREGSDATDPDVEQRPPRCAHRPVVDQRQTLTGETVDAG